MAKKKTTADEVETHNVEKLSLEDSMTELSTIVARLESGQESLDESLESFERGMKLLRACHNKLDVAAQRIEIVTQISEDCEVKTADFDATATLQKSASTSRTSRKAAVDDGDDALLF